MELELMNYMAEFGSMGGFCLFLLYLNSKNSKKQDELIKNFSDSIDKMNEHHTKQLDELRIRYDAVIEQYRKERDAATDTHQEERTPLRTTLAHKMHSVELAVVEVQKSLGVISNQLEKGMTLLHEYQLEKKAREIAQKQLITRGANHEAI